MKKALLLIVPLIILAIGAYLVLRPKEATAPTSTESQATESTTSPATTDYVAKGRYVEFSDDVITNTPGTKVLFFHAPWCPQCRALDKSIKESQVPDGVTIIKVDYDSNQALRQKYGVTIQTTLVRVDDNGNLVKKYVAYDEPTLEAVKSNVL